MITKAEITRFKKTRLKKSLRQTSQDFLRSFESAIGQQMLKQSAKISLRLLKYIAVSFVAAFDAFFCC